MALSIPQLAILKSWFLQSGAGNIKDETLLSDATFKLAVDALEERLGKQDILSFETIAQAVRNKDQQYLQQLTLLTQYLNQVLIADPQQIKYVPLADDAFFQLIQESFKQAPAPAVNAPARKPNEIHAAVDAVLRKFSVTMSSLSFPGSVDGNGLQVNDYNVFFHKLSASLAMSGALQHLTLTDPDKEALAGISSFFSKKGAIKIKHLHLNLEKVEITEDYIQALVTTLQSVRLGDITEVSLVGANITEENLAQLVARLIENEVTVGVKLPGDFSKSRLQKELDTSVGNAERRCRISQMSQIREQNELGEAYAAPKRTRVRMKEKSANIEVELQQQQQVEVQVHRARTEDQDDNNGLNIVTFDELKELILARKLPLSFDKFFVTHLELKKAWNSWFGHVATYMTPDGKLVGAADAVTGSEEFNTFNNNIFEHITEQACVELLKYPRIFNYGLDYTHLPAGFQIINDPDGRGKVLHFNEMMAHIYSGDDLAIKPIKTAEELSPCDAVTNELLSAFEKHPCYPLVREYLTQLEQAADYDRQAISTLRKLLPELFNYTPAGLTHRLTMSKITGKADINMLQAILTVISNRDEKDKLKLEDPILFHAATLWGDFFASNRNKGMNLKRVDRLIEEHHLLLVLAKHHQEFSRVMQRWIKSTRCTISELDALYDVYVYYGIEGLKKIVSLADQYGRSFDLLRDSLQFGNNYLQCINDPRAVRALRDICDHNETNFTPEQLGWFHTLLQQHAAEVKEFNLADMVDAFAAFVKKTKEYNLKFYLPVGFSGVRNMTVAMGRMLSILKLTDPKERQAQWNCITRLPLEADGAIHAVQDNESGQNVCHVVTPEMETFAEAYGAAVEHQYNDYRRSVNHKAYRCSTGFANLTKYIVPYIDKDSHKIKREFIDREFYRFIAGQDYRRPIEEYPDLLAIIQKQKFQPEVEQILYRVLAETSTGLANRYENDKYSRDEYRKLFKKMVDELASCRLSIALMATITPLLYTAIGAYRLAGKNFMMDELRAPHASYGLDDLLKLGVMDEVFVEIKTMPPLTSLYYLMYFVSNGLKDIGIARLINEEDKKNAFRIMEDLKDLTYGDYLIPFCHGMKYFSDSDVKSVDECRIYIDTCKVIKSKAFEVERDRRNAYIYGSYSYSYGVAVRRIQYEDVYACDIAKKIISIISTFNMRDEVAEICNKKLAALDTSTHGKKAVFAIDLLKSIDLEIGRKKSAPTLTVEHFRKFIDELILECGKPEYDNAVILKRVSELFGEYFPEGFFEQFDVTQVSSEARKKVGALFALPSDQTKCLNFIDRYRDVSDVQQYEKLFAIFTHFSKRISSSDMSTLLGQIDILANIYEQSGQPQPPLAEYIRLLELVLNQNEFNTLDIIISSTRKEIKGLEDGDARKATLQNDYLAKVFCFIEKLAPLYRVKGDDSLFQRELMRFTCKLLNESSLLQIVQHDFKHPSIEVYTRLNTKVLSDERIAIWCNEPAIFESHLSDMIAAMPELGLIPEIINAKRHVAAINEENAKNAAALQAQTIWQKAQSVAANLQTAGANAVNSMGTWFQKMTGTVPVANRPNIVVQKVLGVDKAILVAARTAITNKLESLKTYPGVAASIVENMRLLVNAYPATCEEIVGFFKLYCSNVQRAGTPFEDAVANIIKLRKLLLDLDNEKIAYALCFNFNNATDEECHAPETLFNIINSESFDDLSKQNQKLLIGILVKLLNNKSISDLAQFETLLKRLLENGSEALFKDLEAIYASAPYPSIDILLVWMDDHHELIKQYHQFELLPCRRGCADDEPNGFKLKVAIEKSKLITGIDLTEEELKALSKQTERVRELTISELTTELAKFRQDSFDDAMLAQLVAITAELLYRAKGSAPANEDPANRDWGASFEINTTQYLAIYSMLKRGEHVTGEIGTGEGKTRIMMIHLACQFALGKTVDFITSDSSLANREFTEYQSYFDLLGAQSRLIHAYSPANHYAIRGINFSDPASVELFRNHAHSDGLSKLVIDPQPGRRALMLDEGDKAFFDLADTRFNYSAASDEMLRDMEWVYPLLAAYFMERKENDPTSYRFADLFYDDMDKCIEEFYNYISKIHEPNATPEQYARIKLLSQQQLEGWFEAAITARDLKFNKDFVIEQDTEINTVYGRKFASEAKLIVGFRKDPRSKYSFGVHQCLHARLNIVFKNVKQDRVDDSDDEALKEILKNCQHPFHIEEEKQIIYTSSSKTLLNDYDKGTLYAVTGTAGSISERQEAAMLYAKTNADPDIQPVKMHFIDIPRHKGLRRVDMPVRLVANDKQEIKFLAMEIIASRLKNQPCMIVCSDDAECHRIAEGVEKYLASHSLDKGEMFLVDSMTDPLEENKRINNDIGRANVVTFTTPKLGRGVDVRIHGEAAQQVGLKTIPTGTMMRHRDYYQVIARAGRFGKPGESRVILNKSRVKKQLGKTTLTDGFYTSPQTYIRRQQAIIDRNKQVERLMKFAFVDFRSKMQSALYNDFQYALSESGRSLMRRLWQTCSTELDQKWNAVYERIVHELHKAEIDDAVLNELLQEMHEFAAKQWSQLTLELSQNDGIVEMHKINQCLDGLMKEVPSFKLESGVVDILKNYSLDKVATRTTPIYDKYDPAHDGQAAIYRGYFERLRATLNGERRWFADLRAWWKGRGILFPNIRAWWRGDLTFKQLILGGKGEPAVVDVNATGSSTAAIAAGLGGILGTTGATVDPSSNKAVPDGKTVVTPTAAVAGVGMFNQAQFAGTGTGTGTQPDSGLAIKIDL